MTDKEITPEFLKNNGFLEEHDNILNHDYYVTKDRRVTVAPCFDLVCDIEPSLWSCHVDDVDMDTIGRLKLRFVSELKSFLELCKYDKKFTNE